MNRPPIRSLDPSHATLAPNASQPAPTHLPQPQGYEQLSPHRSSVHHDGVRQDYEQLPPMHGLQHSASHVHMPSVATYIAHYHSYTFNGNCTVQQASTDGHPNTIQMVNTSTNPPNHSNPPPPQPRVDIPPVPPISIRNNGAHVYHYAHDTAPAPPPPPPPPPAPQSESDKRPPSAAYTLPMPTSHLPPMAGGPSRLSTTGPSAPTAPPTLARQSGFLGGGRLGKPPTSGPGASSTGLLPRLRGPLDGSGPIALAPLHEGGIPSISALQQEDKGRPTKRSRLGRGVAVGIERGGGSESNCASVSEDRRAKGAVLNAGGQGGGANSSSPSHEYGGQVERGRRNVEESQSNDWEAVVEMYTTGKGTEDGVALKMITKGDGRRVADRKLLEKRRTIGKTYECLGAERFEAAIGYKWENGVRRKQKMYHVISRCRVVNAMRKAGERIPLEYDKLTALIDERIAEKEAIKEAGKNAARQERREGSGDDEERRFA